MAHMIDVTTGRAAFAYAAEDGPGWWEGQGGLKGTPLHDSRCSVKDACEAAGLLWHPWEERLYCQDANGCYSIPLDRKVIRRGDNGGVLGFAALSYETVPHAVHFQAAARPLIECSDGRWSSCGATRDGQRYFASFKLGTKTIAGDEHAHIVSVIGGYDQLIGVIFTTSLVRVVCNNTMTQALQDRAAKSLRFAHTRNANARLVTASEALMGVHASADKLGEALAATANVKVTADDVRRVLERLYPPPKPAKKADANADAGASLIDQILSLPDQGVSSVGRQNFEAVLAATEDLASKPGEGRLIKSILEAYEGAPGARPGSAYGLIQAVTYVETHERGRSGEDRYLKRLTSTKGDSEILSVVYDELKIARAAA